MAVDNGFHNNLEALLKSFANGQVLNHKRGEKRSPVSRSGEPTSSSETPTSGLDINRALDVRGFAAQVMPKLVDEHRAVIEAIVLNGHSYCEAAEVLNIQEGTLRSRFMAAKRVLAEHAERLLPPSQRGPR